MGEGFRKGGSLAVAAGSQQVQLIRRRKVSLLWHHETLLQGCQALLNLTVLRSLHERGKGGRERQPNCWRHGLCCGSTLVFVARCEDCEDCKWMKHFPRVSPRSLRQHPDYPPNPSALPKLNTAHADPPCPHPSTQTPSSSPACAPASLARPPPAGGSASRPNA